MYSKPYSFVPDMVYHYYYYWPSTYLITNESERDTMGEVKFRYAKSLRQKSKTQVWYKTQLKTELDLATKTGSKNVLRPNSALRLLS